MVCTRESSTLSRVPEVFDEAQDATYHLWQGQGQHEQVSRGDTTLQVSLPQDYRLRAAAQAFSVCSQFGADQIACGCRTKRWEVRVYPGRL